jgi:hypothetical protein
MAEMLSAAEDTLLLEMISVAMTSLEFHHSCLLKLAQE